jgi:glyoxylase-like metal-dependent hydrolase (beta-lactamase superfamily II)
MLSLRKIFIRTNKIIFFCTVALFISSFAYGQTKLDNADYDNYLQANEIFSKIARHNYSHIDKLGYNLSGTWYYPGHFPTPDERLVVPITNTVSGQYGKFFELESHIVFRNSEMLRREYFSADSSFVLDYGEKEPLSGDVLKKESFLVFYSPVTLFWDMEQNRRTLRYLGDDNASQCHVISYTSSFYRQASVFVGMSDFTIRAVEFLNYSNIRGDYMLQFFYKDYETDTFDLPAKLTVKEWGSALYEMNCNYTLVSGRTENPTEGYAVEEIGKNLYAVSYPTGEHRFYLVDFGDYWGVIETPVSEVYAEQLSSVIRQKFPKKPVKYAFLTHHHPDHAGGFAYFYRNGATVVTTTLSREYQEELLAGKHSLRNDSITVMTETLRSFLPEGNSRLRQLRLGCRSLNWAKTVIPKNFCFTISPISRY